MTDEEDNQPVSAKPGDNPPSNEEIARLQKENNP